LRRTGLIPVLALVLPGILLMLPLSCVNDIREVNALTLTDSLPDETAHDIEVIYSTSGRVEALLTSPYMERFEGREPRTVFPDGIFVVFYDSLMNVRSDLRANHAISHDNTAIMEARGNVVVNNYRKEETIDTEHLVWDQNAHEIRSEVFVKITTPDKVLYGEEGFEADEWLNRWIIRKPRGTFEVEGDE